MKFINKNILKKQKEKNIILNTGCSEFELDNWELSNFIIKKILPIVGISPFPLNEIYILVYAVLRSNPDHLFEWGTHIGKSARIFYETAQYFKLKYKIHSIDLPDDIFHVEHPYEKRGMLVSKLNNIKLYQGDGISTSLEIIKELGNVNNPLFFLDGDHEFSSVKEELEKIIVNLPNANILIHDTFYQSSESHYNIGPFLAIKYVLENIDNDFSIISSDTGLPGLTFLLRR